MSRLHTSLIISAIIFVGGLALWGGLYIMTERNIDRITDLSEKVTEQNSRGAQAQRMVTVVKQVQEVQEVFREHLVSEADIVPVIEIIEDLAKEAGASATILGLTTDETATSPVGSLSKVRGKVEAQGTWTQLLTYMTALEDLPYRIIISGVSLRRNETVVKGKPAQWNMSFTMEILKIK